MNPLNFLPLRSIKPFRAIAALCAIVLAPLAQAANVIYSSSQFDVAGNVPFSLSSVPITIQRPSNTPIGTTVSLKVVALNSAGWPIEAPSAITVVPSTVTFLSTLPGAASTSFVVVANYAALSAAPGSTSIFQYKVYTDVWSNGASHVDPGFNVNATVTVPPGGTTVAPPRVTISTPLVDEQIPRTPAELGVLPVTLDFDLSTDSPQTLHSYQATYTGPGVTPQGAAITLSPASPTPGSTSLSVTGDMAVASPGDYTVEVRAVAKNGTQFSADAVVTRKFTVFVKDAPAPVVTISNPAPKSATNPEAEFSYFVPGPAVDVPVAFTATTDAPTSLVNWKTVLTRPNGSTLEYVITPTTPPSGSTSATGSSPLNLLTDSGHYFVDITAWNEYRTGSQTTSFWINRISNPASVTIDAFQNAAFAVTASGNGPFTYQWERAPAGSDVFAPVSDGGPYAGSQSPTLNVTSARRGMSGDKFRCVITTSTNRQIQSGPATLTVNKLTPTIEWATPAPITVGTLLSAVQLNALAKYNGVEVDGTYAYFPSSGAALPIGAQQALSVTFSPTDTENYNGATGGTTITVIALPTLTITNPASQTVNAGQSATFSVTASGATPITYQWQRKAAGGTTFVDISGATSPTFTVANTTTAMSGDQFRCVATNVILGSVTSAAATLTVNAVSNPSLTITDPASQMVAAGISATFAVTATASDAPGTITYQWQRKPSGGSSFSNVAGSNYSGATTPTLTVSNTTVAMSGDQFRCVATLGSLTATSNPATLTVAPAGLTLVINQPTTTTITRVVGSPATVVPFSFTAKHSNGTVLTLTAKLGNTSLDVTKSGLNTATATGTGSFKVSTAGTYTFTAKATGSGNTSKAASVTITVKETQPVPVCTTTVVWTGDLAGSGYFADNKKAELSFKLKECCTTSCGGGHDDDDDDRDDHGDRDDDDHGDRDDDDHKGHYDDDDRDHHGDSDGSSWGSWGHDNDDHGDRDDDDDDNDDHNGGSNSSTNCDYVSDKTVVVSVSEVLSNGSLGTPRMYTWTSGSPGTTKFNISSSGEYTLYFQTASGKHTYRIEVDRFPSGSSTPQLVGSKDFKAK